MKAHLLLGLLLAASLTGCGQNASPGQGAASPATTVAATSTPAKAPPSKPAAPEPKKGDGPTMMTHSECGVQFQLPEGWLDEQQNGMLMVHPKDDTVFVLFMTPEAEEVDSAGQQLEALIGQMIQDPQIEGEGEETELNGMKAFSCNGTGTSDGKPVHFSMDFVQAKKPLIILAIGEQDGLVKHGTDVQALADSISPL